MAETINFTKATLDSLPLPSNGQRIEYCDSRQSSLRIRVTSTGVKTFCVLKRIPGAQMERITLSRYPTMSIEQARKKAIEILGKIAEGNNPNEVRRAIKEEPTFKEFFKDYSERHGKHKRSWKADLQRYRDYLERPLGKQKLSAITPPMIARVLSDMERALKANATINNVRALASGIFAKAIEWGLCTNNPVSATKMRKKKSRDRFLQGHELPRFFSALMEEPNSTVRDYFLMSLLTGARRSNVLAMRWKDINFKDRIWRIERTKNDDPQNVTLSQEALDILVARKNEGQNDSPYVFPGEGKTGHLVEPKKAWKRIFDRDELLQLTEIINKEGGGIPTHTNKLGAEVYESLDSRLARARSIAISLDKDISDIRISDIRIHDLRRTLGSWQAMTGASLPIIGKSLNHKSTQATAIYARLDLDPVRASVEKATEAMLRAAGAQALDQE